jgi:hypothetical protein
LSDEDDESESASDDGEDEFDDAVDEGDRGIVGDLLDDVETGSGCADNVESERVCFPS